MNLPKEIVSLYAPTVFKAVSGQKYFITTGTKGDWVPIDDSVTLEDVRKNWIPLLIAKKEPETTNGRTFSIKNSKGDGYYMVVYENNHWSCGCHGYGFRRKCRHIKQAKEEI